MNNKIKILPLGGMQEYGKNMICIEDNENIIIVDAGMKFPEFSHFGIEKIISNFEYLEENKDKVKAIFISHVHEENVGALEYILKKINVKVYLSDFSRRYLETTLPQFRKNYKSMKNNVKFGQFDVTFYNLSHNIFDSSAILINTPQGSIIYDGDSTFDTEQPSGFNSQLSDLIVNAKKNKKGVLALLLNSRNALLPETLSNNASKIKKEVSDAFFTKTKKMFVIMHSEDLLTFKYILKEAKLLDTKVYINSYKLFHYLQAARKSGFLKEYKDVITTDYNEIEKVNGVVIIGENENTLFEKMKNIVLGKHPVIKFNFDDSIFIATISNILNEGYYQKESNALYEYTSNIKMISSKDVKQPYMSKNDLKLFISLFNPKYILPRNSEYREMAVVKNSISEDMNLDPKNVLILNNGNYVTFSDSKVADVNYKNKNMHLYIENGKYGDTENRVLSDRERFSESGTIIANVVIKRNTNKLIGKPKFVSSGLLEEKYKRELSTKLETAVKDLLSQNQEENITLSTDELKQNIYKICARTLRKQYDQQPQIFVIIMEL